MAENKAKIEVEVAVNKGSQDATVKQIKTTAERGGQEFQKSFGEAIHKSKESVFEVNSPEGIALLDSVRKLANKSGKEYAEAFKKSAKLTVDIKNGNVSGIKVSNATNGTTTAMHSGTGKGAVIGGALGAAAVSGVSTTLVTKDVKNQIASLSKAFLTKLLPSMKHLTRYCPTFSTAMKTLGRDIKAAASSVVHAGSAYKSNLASQEKKLWREGAIAKARLTEAYARGLNSSMSGAQMGAGIRSGAITNPNVIAGYNKIQKLSNLSAISRMKALDNGFLSGLKSSLGFKSSAFSEIFKGSSGLGGKIRGVFNSLVGSVAGGVTSLTSKIGPYGALISAALETVGNALKTAFEAFLAVATGLAAAGYAASKKAGAEEQSSNVIRAKGNFTKEEQQRLDSLSKKVANERQGVDVKDVQQAVEAMVQQGYKFQEITNMLPTVVDFAKDNDLGAAEAVKIIGSIVTGWKKDSAEGKEVGDKVTAATLNSPYNAHDVGEIISHSATTSSQLGRSFEDTIAMAMVLGQQGIEASVAGTMLSSGTLRTLDKSAIKVLEENGIDASLANGGKIWQVNDAIRQKAAKEDWSAEKTNQVFSAYYGKENFRLSGLSGASIAASREAIDNSEGTLASITAARAEGVGGAYGSIGSQFDVWVSKIGDAINKALEPVIKHFADFDFGDILNLLTNWIQELIDFIKNIQPTIKPLFNAIYGYFKRWKISLWDFGGGIISTILGGINKIFWPLDYGLNLIRVVVQKLASKLTLGWIDDPTEPGESINDAAIRGANNSSVFDPTGTLYAFKEHYKKSFSEGGDEDYWDQIVYKNTAARRFSEGEEARTESIKSRSDIMDVFSADLNVLSADNLKKVKTKLYNFNESYVEQMNSLNAKIQWWQEKKDQGVIDAEGENFLKKLIEERDQLQKVFDFVQPKMDEVTKLLEKRQKTEKEVKDAVEGVKKKVEGFKEGFANFFKKSKEDKEKEKKKEPTEEEKKAQQRQEEYKEFAKEHEVSEDEWNEALKPIVKKDQEVSEEWAKKKQADLDESKAKENLDNLKNGRDRFRYYEQDENGKWSSRWISISQQARAKIADEMTYGAKVTHSGSVYEDANLGFAKSFDPQKMAKLQLDKQEEIRKELQEVNQNIINSAEDTKKSLSIN